MDSGIGQWKERQDKGPGSTQAHRKTADRMWDRSTDGDEGRQAADKTKEDIQSQHVEGMHEGS